MELGDRVVEAEGRIGALERKLDHFIEHPMMVLPPRFALVASGNAVFRLNVTTGETWKLQGDQWSHIYEPTGEVLY